MSSFHLFFLLLITSQVLSQSCLVGRPREAELEKCTWYNDNTCCSPGEGADNFSPEDLDRPCGAPSKNCRDQLTLARCGGCSTEWASYISVSPLGVRFCKSFVDKVYNECKDYETVTIFDTSCKRVADRYENGEEMLNGLLGIGAIYHDGKENCFNTAGMITPIAFLAPLLLALAVVL